MTHTIRGARRRHVAYLVALFVASLSPVARSQESAAVFRPMISLAGPRVGITVMSSGVVNRLKRESIDITGVVTQFGWQSEKRFYSDPGGVSGVTEGVLLIGGTEQGQFLPSFTWLVGFRTTDGMEFGVGPNVTPLGVSLALAGGITYRVGALNVPVNLAFVPSASGVRLSLLTGFNMGTR